MSKQEFYKMTNDLLEVVNAINRQVALDDNEEAIANNIEVAHRILRQVKDKLKEVQDE